jgi:glycosyltransferase involved in cell wall biosynthesis
VQITLLTVARNESQSGHLEEFIKYNLPLVNNFVAYDDCSDDQTATLLGNAGAIVLRGEFPQFKSEISIRDRLLKFAKSRFPNTTWFVILDLDEVLLWSRVEMETLLSEATAASCDGIYLPLINLWRSESFLRTDDYYDCVSKVHFWRNSPDLVFSIEYGLHRELHPNSIQKIYRPFKLALLHRGFSTKEKIINKFQMYQQMGQRGRSLWRLIDESTLQLAHLESRFSTLGSRGSEWLNSHQEEIPTKIDLADYLWAINEIPEAQVKKTSKPIVTLICLIYSGIDWLEFAYGELLQLQNELNPGLVEILFCANDGNIEVIEFLKENKVPHFIFENNDKNEYYINRVYRAYNAAVKHATAEYVLLLNSDMAYQPGFLTQMLNQKAKHKLIVSRLIESGTLKPGQFAIKRNFGKKIKQFKRERFYKYADKIVENFHLKGGLYMPLLVNRNEFLSLRGFPEGNITPKSLNSYIKGDQPVISHQGDECVSGDYAFMLRAADNGLEHLTFLGTSAYHFQEGEKRHASQKLNLSVASGIALANDNLKGVNGEEVLWDTLRRILRDSGVGVLDWNLGGTFYFPRNMFNRKKRLAGNPRLVFQNCTYIPKASKSARTVSLLQDRVFTPRIIALQNKVQELSNSVVTNSIAMLGIFSKTHFYWLPLPMNELWWNTPLPSKVINERIKAIIIGAFNETKGWNDCRKLIEKRQDIDFILVSKYEHDCPGFADKTPKNVKIFRNLSRSKIIELVDQSDVFILGSPFETQSLAALEAASRNLPIVMRRTGLLSFSPIGSNFGYFEDNLETAFKNFELDFDDGKIFSSRFQIETLGLNPLQLQKRWQILLENELRMSFLPNVQTKKNLVQRIKRRIFDVKVIRQPL